MKDDSSQYKQELLELLGRTSQDRRLLADLLDDILTPDEFDMISRRWQIVKRLAAGEAQQHIARDLQVGIATVTRGSRELKKKNSAFRRVLRIMK